MTDVTHVGSYRLVARLGQGGTADVFLAFVTGLKGSGFAKLAVVKRLRPNLAEDPEFVSMLMDEGRLTARLSHPNIVQMFEVGRDGEDYFLAMEHLDGQPLHHIERRILKNKATVPNELYYSIISDVLGALHYAHELADYDGTQLGIVHRDVTPHNIFVTYDGVVKVVDFGIAKAVGRLTETRQGIIKGKVRYMSPEQAAGAEVDRRTDIFAAGVLLYKAASGQKFWSTRDEFEIPRALVTGDYDPSPRAINKDVPEAIDAICRKALAFNPNDRYETALQMQSDLDKAAANAPSPRELGARLREMFATERENLKTILAGAAVELAASATELGIAPHDDEVGGEDSTRMMTVVMAGAPQRPAPSVAPIAVSVPKTESTASGAKARQTPVTKESVAPQQRGTLAKRAALGLAVGAMVASIAIAFATSHRASASNEVNARSPRAAASDRVAMDPPRLPVTPSSRPAPATSGERSAMVAAASVSAPRPSSIPKHTRSSAAIRATSAAAPPATPATPESRPAPTTATTSSSMSIDTGDPWSRGGRR